MLTNTAKTKVWKKVGSCDEEAPGARLFVITGTNTAVSGPIQGGTGIKYCASGYHGWVTFKTNNSIWFSPHAGSTSCTITDLSRNNYNPAYVPMVQAVENATLKSWCGINTVTFPVNSSYKYQFTTFIMNTLPPPNVNDIISLDMNWQ